MSNLEKNIVLIGMPGSGKTTIGRILAKKLGTRFYDSDKYIELTTGKSISEIFQDGEEFFRQLETKALNELAAKIPCVIATGGGAVKNIQNIEILKSNGIIIFINRPLEKIAEKINTEKRPLLKNNKENLYKLYDERIGLYKEYCDYEIVNDNALDDAVNQIIKIINKY